MAHDMDDSKIRDYLRLLGNPYAKLQVQDAPDAPPLTEVRSPDALAPKPLGLTRTNIEGRLFPEPRHGNPYASLAALDDADEPGRELARPPGLAKTSSKADFIAGCRRIFSQYIPQLEKGLLRDEHRDFITRNASRSPTIRFKLLEALRRYDLSDLPGAQPQFNREDDRLTAKKLIEIEQAVATDE
jgi:hypothetical protein